VETRMDAMNQYLDGYKERVTVESIKNLQDKRAFELKAEVIKARSANAAAADTSAVLQKQLDEARSEADAVSEAIFKSTDLSYAVTQLRERLSALDSRIDDCELEAKAPIHISIDKRAASPSRPAVTNRNKLLFLALLIGFGGVLAIVLGFDLLDNRIRSPREIELALGAPGPDPIASYVSSVPSTSQFSRAVLDEPDHPAVRAIRELAVRLNFDRERHGGRVFLFSGISPGCGTTALTLNVAQALAAICPDVLLLEANLKRPGLRALLGLPPGPGLETALRGGPPWQSLLQADPLRGIRVLAAEGGASPESKALLVDILKAARKSHGAVLVDAGSVLDDDVAYFAALHADAVVLVAREDVSLYRDLRHAIDRLVQGGVPALTAVLNHAQPLWLGGVLERLQQNLGWMTEAHRRALHAWRNSRFVRKP
jgi:polysaccharide biosynthesis transport protein